ncbi:sucrase ferredoxin [Spongisporangium articulatum]|uniref:Sucrase ferredoxin n=1 Tax=Spongisporangium articulatum TaxID=3362603 RepID=A0ABW8AQG6_9ACTN
MTFAEPAPTCSALSAAAGEPLAGSAPVRRAWALVEHPGPWGRDALLDSPWPDGEGARLEPLADSSGVKVLLARRHRTRPADGVPPEPWVTLAHVGPQGWVVGARVPLPELEKLPLDDVAAGRRPVGWSDVPGVWGVCTHGVRDQCCARLGRPVAATLNDLDPENTWEISHSGGHRMAGVVLALPEGQVYGRVEGRHVVGLAAARASGEVLPELLRGSSWLGEPEQAADVALRLFLGTAGRELRATTWESSETLGDATVLTRWTSSTGAWVVPVRREALPERPGSCGKAPEPASAWFAGPPTRP